MQFVDSELEILVYWMNARDSIRAKKEQGLPKPWTEDELLRSYRWCNVRRMDDRVSAELLAHWYQHDSEFSVALVAAVLARLVNWTESLMEITGGQRFGLERLDRVRNILLARAQRGEKVFTGAYVVPGVPGKVKVVSVCDLVELIQARAGQIYAPSMHATWSNLISFDGLGSFLAGQIVADLAHLRVGEGWEDRDAWAPIGPGSNRGMNRLLGQPKDRQISQAEFDELLPRLIRVLKPRVAGLWADRRLQAMDIQNCLCEFDKYRRLQMNEGKVRAKYDGLGSLQGTLWQ